MDKLAFKVLDFYKIRDILLGLARTVFGREKIDLLLPSADKEEVENRLKETLEGVKLITSASGGVPLGMMEDVRMLLKRLELGAVLLPEDFLHLLNLLTTVRRLKDCVSNAQCEIEIIPSLVFAMLSLPEMEKRIEKTVDEQGEVRDQASSLLAKVRKEKRILKARVKEKIESYLHNEQYKKYLQESIVTMRGERYVLPVKQEYRGMVSGIVHDQSASGSTLFIEPIAIVNFNNELKKLDLTEKEEIEKILRALSLEMAVHTEGLMNNCILLGDFDLILAKGALAILWKAEKPMVSEERKVVLVRARHPLIDQKEVVPIDLAFGKELETLLITGPNTGGKTVALKTLGLFALLMQSGLFLPSGRGTSLPVFANVYADIGDEQSIEQSLSTFSSHMTNLIYVLKKVQANDLVLADELGAGTDPDEGAALAIAILEKLREIKALVVITTHYNDLKTYAFKHEGMENASVEFDTKTLKPTYRLLQGIPGSSNAFAISSRLGLSDDVLKKAAEIIGNEHINFEKVLFDIDAERRKLEESRKEVQVMEAEITKLKEVLQKEELSWKEKKKELWQKARLEAQEWVLKEKRKADELIEQIKKLKQSQELFVQQNLQSEFNEVRSKLREHASLLEEEIFQTEMQGADFEQVKDGLKVGQAVRCIKLGQIGTVLEVNGENVKVEIGRMKLQLTLKDLQVVKEKALKDQKRKNKYEYFKKNSYFSEEIMPVMANVKIKKELDIRGQTVDEAIPFIDKHIDEAVMAGLSEVLIIHGKGTGLLRNGVRDYLKRHSAVKKISIAELNEGGNGATIVLLC